MPKKQTLAPQVAKIAAGRSKENLASQVLELEKRLSPLQAAMTALMREMGRVVIKRADFDPEKPGGFTMGANSDGDIVVEYVPGE